MVKDRVCVGLRKKYLRCSGVLLMEGDGMVMRWEVEVRCYEKRKKKELVCVEVGGDAS